MFFSFSFQSLIERYHSPGARAFALMGSHARGDAGPHSDLDLVRFVDDTVNDTAAYTHLVDGQLVVISTVTPAQVAAWFSEPEAATSSIAGVRSARPLVDADGYFAAIQARAHAFVWDEAMQAKANHYASEMLVGLIEEVHKGLEGLRRDHTGRLLNARFGLSWLLSRTVQVQRGVLISGDNGFYDELAQSAEIPTRWIELRRAAFGIAETSLRQQVMAGLQLYIETAQLLDAALHADQRPLIHATVERIQRVSSL